MTQLPDRYVEVPDVSHAWLAAVRMLASTPGGKAVHVVLRIADPTREELRIRAAAQQLIDQRNAVVAPSKELPDIETTRNTIFPAAWAQRNPQPAALGAYYRERYTKDGLLGFNQNGKGTYFGRIVAFPRGEGQAPGDQLVETVRKIKAELASGSNKSSRYEINIFCERTDTGAMSFPCLAHVSVHLHERQLHMQAIYRNEYLVGRAYGNYLGLAQLQTYISEQTETSPGELLMTLGHVELESGTKRAVQQMLASLDS